MSFIRANKFVTILCLLMFAWAGSALAQSPPTIVKSFTSATVSLNESVTLTFTITNPNPATDLTGVSFNDNMPAGLIIANPDSVGGTCDTSTVTTLATSLTMVGATILANSSCTVSVDVLAITAGDQVNTTDPITSNEGGTGGTATAIVSVVVPDLTVTLSHTGNFLSPQTGATYTITVSNSGGADTTAVITVSDSLPTGLTATDLSGPNWNCTVTPLQCTRGDTLFAGTSFEPITLTVNVANNAPASVTNTVTVSGGNETNTANDTASDPTQIDAALALAAQTTSATVTGGSTATSTLNVTVNPAAGLGAITFACSGLPALATCSFNPTSVTTTGAVTMSIATTAKSTTTPPGTTPIPPAFYVALFGLFGLMTAALGMERAKKLRWRLAAGFACLALLALAGCGSSSTPHAPGTPTGTFAVKVTASSANGGATATSTVNLTVQ